MSLHARSSFLKAIGLVAFLALGACGGRAPDAPPPKLMNIKGKKGGLPDEFSILRTAPLETDIAQGALPTPSVGASNITDLHPFRQAIEALGGDISAGAQMTEDERALLAYTGRFGRASDIRATLRLEDEQFRRDHKPRVFERLARLNLYFKAYREQTLEPFSERTRLKRQQVKVVDAPLFLLKK